MSMYQCLTAGERGARCSRGRSARSAQGQGQAGSPHVGGASTAAAQSAARGCPLAGAGEYRYRRELPANHGYMLPAHAAHPPSCPPASPAPHNHGLGEKPVLARLSHSNGRGDACVLARQNFLASCRHMTHTRPAAQPARTAHTAHSLTAWAEGPRPVPFLLPFKRPGVDTCVSARQSFPASCPHTHTRPARPHTACTAHSRTGRRGS